MTQNDFLIACLEFNIDPDIALESESVINAIKSGDLTALYSVLENEC
jgi:hypothetical protein